MAIPYVLQETAVREPSPLPLPSSLPSRSSILPPPPPNPTYQNLPPGSQYGWCDTDFAHCDPANCLKGFSGPGSSCATGSSVSKSTLKTTSSTKPSSTSAYVSSIPNIDVCGSAAGGVRCPGAGTNGYFYRCCSNHGHCGPKNDVLLPSIAKSLPLPWKKTPI